MDWIRYGDITGFDDAEIIDDEEVNDNDNEQQDV